MMARREQREAPEAVRDAPYSVPGAREADMVRPILPTGSPMVGAFRMGAEERQPIGEKEIARAAEILTEYKQGKAALENRVIQDELWWELRHWEVMREKRKCAPPEVRPEPTSAWLFNAILNKHADAMDNYPEPVVLPRERSDEGSAKTLSSVLPVVLEYNDFEQTYSDNWWDKLKHGTAVYGVFWNSQKENGLGDIDIREIDLLKIFWEPGITDIQASRNLFIVELVDEEVLDQRYPEHRGKMAGRSSCRTTEQRSSGGMSETAVGRIWYSCQKSRAHRGLKETRAKQALREKWVHRDLQVQRAIREILVRLVRQQDLEHRQQP